MTAEAAAPVAAGLAAAVATLRGVGPARAASLRAKGVADVLDLLLLTPIRYDAPPPRGDVRRAAPGSTLTIVGRVVSARKTRARSGRPGADLVVDDGGALVRVRYFNRGWFADRAPRGTPVLAWGRRSDGPALELGGAGLRVLASLDDAARAAVALEPVHPSVPGVPEGVLRALLRQALAAADAAEDPLPEDLRLALGLPRLAEALRRVHEPATRADAEEAGARLVFDRLLAVALVARIRGGGGAPEPAPALATGPRVRARILARMPFALTPGQSEALDEILADLERPVAMRRLLAGDVGSGKTAVAVAALLATVAAGAQGLLVAPTEALAAQHERLLATWLAGSRVRRGFLTARTSAPERAALKAAAARGEIDLLVGTHAALSRDVLLPNLGLAVVDEQHRFGVLQRLAARSKAKRPHLLALSATPIPRTLGLCLFGDLRLTRLRGRPAGRATPAARVADSVEAFDAVRAAVGRGERAFVVFPSIRGEGTPALEREGRALVKRGGPLAGLCVAWLHGDLPPAERDAALAGFRAGTADVLVATVIVEVGVDVPEATTMVVMGAERFGLATLHQLRGRVGRGTRPGTVFLVAGGGPGGDAANGGAPKAAGAVARARLEKLAREDDGLRLAELDLELRGPGDFCGVRQHGRGGALPLHEGRDRGFLEAAASAAETLIARGYDSRRGDYFGRLAEAVGGPAFDPPDAL